MPKISRKRPRDGQEASRSSTQASTGTVIPGDLSKLSISELKNLCRELNFSSTGGRRVLVKRLENERNRRTQSTSQASITTNNTTSVPTERESFSADQIAQITQIVSQSISLFFDSQQTASRVVELPAVPSPTPLTRLEQLGQFPFLSSSELQQSSTSSDRPVASTQQADGGFTPEIPDKYVRDIESGEFFELAKLLPKNLNTLDVGSDSSDNVGFTISSAGISLTPRKPQVLTNIEEWTTAFNTYIIIIVQKFPNRASELLQYMEIIRHAAKAHGGLGWCIYDHKCRHKAAASRTLSWANIDMQLWLRIFTASSTILFSPMDPQTKLRQRGTQSAIAITGVDHVHYDPIVPTLTDVTELAVRGIIQGTHAHNPVMNTIAQNTPVQNPIEAPKRQTKSRDVSLLSNISSIDNRSNLIPLDSNNIVTPIHVDALEDALRGHPDPSFVLKLCSDLRFGARLGYDGPRKSKFSKNLKSAIDNPTIVSNNLAKEVALGHTAGPFTNPLFANLQVSPIGIVPKKHSDKFRTIFHLSFPKTGESINSFIEKDDFSLQYINRRRHCRFNPIR